MAEEYDPIAAMDQLVSAVQHFARGVRGYFVALTEQGFSDEQALRLTIAWQTAVQRGQFGQED